MQPTVALSEFISRRPGFDFANYGDVPAYRSDVREAGRQLNDARTLLAYVERNNIPVSDDAFRAFGGRLTWDGKKLDYCTGQYYPLEYRRAAAAVLASAIWHYWRPSMSGADSIRKAARLAFGRGLASRFFN
jgi:hypothetical protein